MWLSLSGSLFKLVQVIIPVKMSQHEILDVATRDIFELNLFKLWHHFFV